MADGYISQITLPDNNTYDLRDQNLKVYSGTCTTAAGTAIKNVVTDGTFTLAKGSVIFVNFSVTNSAAVGNLKLKFNGEADENAKSIKYLVNGNDPANIPGAGYLRANQTYMFQYDGTNWVVFLNYYTYSNDFASRIGHYNNILARKAIAAESLIVGDATGYEKVASGVTFDLAYSIVWCTAAVAANASNYANMFLQHYDRNIATGAKSGFTSSANKVIYLIVTINGNIATIDSNVITDTLPSEEDGKIYITLGKLGAQSTGANYFFFYPIHPMLEYKNESVRTYEAPQNLSEISDADDLKAIEAISGNIGLLKKTAENTWTLDTNSYSTTSHNHDTIYVKKSAELLTTNHFSPASLKGPYISKIDNAFYAADKRWSVTVTNITNANYLFDGNYENQSQINANNTATIIMDFDPSHSNVSDKTKYFPGYPYGYILISFYNSGGPSSVSARVYCNYQNHGIGWHNLSFSPLSDNTNNAIVYRSEHQGYYNISEIEFTITAGSAMARVTQIEMHLDRPNSALTPFLSKYNAETLYYNLTAPKFIGALQGNADTATKFSSTRKIELTGAVTGSATTDGANGWTIDTSVNHTHNYAGSSSAGGVATSAIEFSSNATVTLTGDTTGTSAGSKKSWSITTTTKLFSGTANNTDPLTASPGKGKIHYIYNVNHGTTGLFDENNNANSILTFNRHEGNYHSQLGFSSNNNLYYRSFSGTALDNTTSWKQIAFTDSNITGNAVNITGILALANLTKGAENTALMGKGDSTAPAYVSVTPSISITAGTADNAPKINLTVLGVSGTAQELTKASTSVYGVTKLSAAADNNNLAATAKSVYDLASTVNGLLSAKDALVFKGTLDATNGTDSDSSTNRKTVPATGYSAGWVYKVALDGTYAGVTCEIGDLVIAVSDPASGQSAVNNTHWTVIQNNVDGAVFKGTNAFVNTEIIIADGTAGKVKSSGITITTSKVASGAANTTIPTSKAVWDAIDELDFTEIGGGTGDYISKISQANGKISATKSTTSVDIGWTGGTSSGPVLSTSVNGKSDTATIPSASSSASGIVTTGEQTFAGAKTFNTNLTVNGDLFFSHTSTTTNGYITWNSGSWYQRIQIDDNSDSNNAVFTFQQSSNSGTNYSNLFTILDNKSVATDRYCYTISDAIKAYTQYNSTDDSIDFIFA